MPGPYPELGPPDTSQYQKVLNESWPLVDADGKKHAIGIPTRRDTIPVRVRVIFERDGETWLDGEADRWHGQHVHVAVSDPRLQISGVWVDASDVRRR
ncbi:hypothetical protein [Aeromicrobium piscarium]|uniref:Uncharacterized protein n=1 Tax=Aeromicrobium piscarium TaxID=2590901 RepID=A0A554SP87_9ACTN|nr:hypothetical protein [Aeromicrobium piscarium]TSD68150.1 hypothetical protein FNM00_00705 [Aeromicrobium piscarium]